MKLKSTCLKTHDKFRLEPNGSLYTYIGPLDTNIDELQSSWSYKNGQGVELSSDADYVYVDCDTALFKLVPGQRFYLYQAEDEIYIARLHQKYYTTVEDRDGSLLEIYNRLAVITVD